jgi:uncharacterized protein (UPF0276 family)
MVLAGIGLKAPHMAALLQGEVQPPGFIEVHAENAMAPGGPFLRRLTALRDRMPLSLHGVGLSLGGAAPPDERHLARLRELVRRLQPDWFSEHLAWSGHGGAYLADLLPVSYDRPTLDRVCRHVGRLQDALGLQVAIENPSTYLAMETATMDEGEFLHALVRRSGCALLLDVTNGLVSAVNHGRDPAGWLRAMPLHAVRQFHLAGHAEDRDAAGDRLLIDHHGAPVAEAVWALYAMALRHTGPRPTLIERDNDVPPLPALLAEAGRAAALMDAAAPVDRPAAASPRAQPVLQEAA